MKPIGHTTSRLAKFCLGAIFSTPASLPSATLPPNNIFGTYGQAKPGSDSVRIARRPNGKIAVAIKLYYAKGHTCHLNQEGDWQADHLAVQAEGLDVSKPCVLSLYFDKGRILLKDPNSLCAAVYCGTRGKFDGVSLSKAGKHE